MLATIQPGGLNKISHDRSRDWKHKNRIRRVLFGATTPASLPVTLGRIRMPVEDQLYTLLCTEMGTSKANAYLWDVDMSPDFQGALESRYAGSPILNGTDPKTAMNAVVLSGSLPKNLSPFTLAKDGPQKTTDWTQWPATLFSTALNYVVAGWLDVSQDAADIFDAVRVALYDARADNAVVMSFGTWYQEWSDAGNARRNVMPMPVNMPVALHCYIFIDWIYQGSTPYLVAQLSSGPEFGDNGFLLFSREVINFAFADMENDGTGVYIFRKSGNRLAQLISIGYALLGKAQALLARLRAS